MESVFRRKYRGGSLAKTHKLEEGDVTDDYFCIMYHVLYVNVYQLIMHCCWCITPAKFRRDLKED